MALFGIEFLSRGAKKVYLCDISKKAINIIKKNLIKTKLNLNAEILNKDYKECLNEFKLKNIQFNIIYIDPPYKENISAYAVKIISDSNLLKDNGIIIIETDEKQRDLEELKKIENLKYEVYDSRKYGRAYLIFLRWGKSFTSRKEWIYNGNIYIIRNYRRHTVKYQRNSIFT